jgi:hypothetical protein
MCCVLETAGIKYNSKPNFIAAQYFTASGILRRQLLHRQLKAAIRQYISFGSGRPTALRRIFAEIQTVAGGRNGFYI